MEGTDQILPVLLLDVIKIYLHLTRNSWLKVASHPRYINLRSKGCVLTVICDAASTLVTYGFLGASL